MAADNSATRIKRTEAYAEKVRQLFTTTVNEILALNKTAPTLEQGVMYSFDAQSKQMQHKVETLLRQLHSVVVMAIQRGISLEWEQANAATDQLVRSMFGKKALSNPQFAAWNNRNNAAQNAFINRSDNGLNLSDRVWKSVKELRDEMEVAITVSVGEGQSARKMSQQVRQYLNDPDLMFRRFRYKDEEGNWQRKWKKRIKKEDGSYGWIDYDKDSYKDQYTGKGYYKSSAQNAMRVARTETNIAYRRADHERWQQLDFVIGQRVQRSKKHPKSDICDKLEGDYPKDFVFDGWHPQCFCYVTPITLSEDETQHLTGMMLRGEDWKAELKRLRQKYEVKDYPANFKQWVRDNADKITTARERGTEPYFIRENASVIDEILNPPKKDNPPKARTPQEIAKERHAARTPEREQQLREYWEKKKAEGDARRKNNVPIEKVTIAEMRYTPDSKRMSNNERVKAACHNIELYFGKNSREYANAKFYIGRTSLSDAQCERFLGDLDAIIGTTNSLELPVINHLMELKKAANQGNIYGAWRTRYNEIVKKLNAYDFTKGYQSVVRDIEEAYNIYRLSVSKAALGFGLPKISSRTPYALFDEFEKKMPGFVDYIPDKDFFDAFPEFVPLFTKKPKGESGAYYQPSRGYVVIGLNDTDTIKRLNYSPWYRKGLIYHEYGHALDDLTGQGADKNLVTIFDDFCHTIKTDPNVLIKMEQSVANMHKSKKDDFEVWWKSSPRYLDIKGRISNAKTFDEKYKLCKELRKARDEEYCNYLYDIEEQLGALTDVLQSATATHAFISPRGHEAAYFYDRDNQLAEFIAHCSENYWSGNDYFKKIAPDLYRQMRKFIESKLPDEIRKKR